MTILNRSYTAGHFESAIDGHKSNAYLKSVEGGSVRAQIVDEPIGGDLQRVKHSSVADYEPFSLECGPAGAGDIVRWIQASWRKDFNRRNGCITHANFDLRQTIEQHFYDALITETTFPALDGSSKDAAFLKVKFQPQRVDEKRTANSNARVSSKVSSKQKLWASSSFRLTIDGVDELKYANKIESFTIKQGIKKFYSGEERFPEIEPTKIEFPNLVGTMSAEYCKNLQKWYDDYVVKGQNDCKAQRTGSLEYLAPDKKTVIFAINLFEVGLVNLQIVQSTANADQIKRVKFEMYVGRMDIDGDGNLGIE